MNKNHIIRQFSRAAGWKFNVFPPTFRFSPLFDFFILGNFMQTFASTGYCQPFFLETDIIWNKILWELFWEILCGNYFMGNIILDFEYYLGNLIWSNMKLLYGKYHVRNMLIHANNSEALKNIFFRAKTAGTNFLQNYLWQNTNIQRLAAII